MAVGFDEFAVRTMDGMAVTLRGSWRNFWR
jgi:hypothetical protein